MVSASWEARQTFASSRVKVQRLWFLRMRGAPKRGRLSVEGWCPDLWFPRLKVETWGTLCVCLS
jgi:hypothetical protein